MKTPKIINAIELIDNELIENANKVEKKPFYIKPVFKRATAIAACLAIVAVSAFALTNKTNNNISSNNNANSNNSSKTSSQNKKVIYVTGEEPDYGINVEMTKSLKNKYISTALQEKMDLYKDYKDAEVVFQVNVEIFRAMEDNAEANRIVAANKEVQLLFEQKEAAYLEEQKAYAEYTAFGENHPDWLANPEKYPELTAECSRLVAIYEAKHEARREISRKWMDLSSEIAEKYFKQVRAERLEFLKQFSEKGPVVISHELYMDLTAEEINVLAEKGGYSLRLSDEYVSGALRPE